MAGIEILPAALLDKKKEDQFILLLQELPIPDRRKKELLVQWTNYVGAALTGDLVKKLLGSSYGEV